MVRIVASRTRGGEAGGTHFPSSRIAHKCRGFGIGPRGASGTEISRGNCKSTSSLTAVGCRNFRRLAISELGDDGCEVTTTAIRSTADKVGPTDRGGSSAARRREYIHPDGCELEQTPAKRHQDRCKMTPYFVVLALATLGTYFVYLLFTTGRRPKDCPPGPPTLPIIGNIHQVVKPCPSSFSLLNP